MRQLNVCRRTLGRVRLDPRLLAAGRRPGDRRGEECAAEPHQLHLHRGAVGAGRDLANSEPLGADFERNEARVRRAAHERRVVRGRARPVLPGAGERRGLGHMGAARGSGLPLGVAGRVAAADAGHGLLAGELPKQAGVEPGQPRHGSR